MRQRTRAHWAIATRGRRFFRYEQIRDVPRRLWICLGGTAVWMSRRGEANSEADAVIVVALIEVGADRCDLGQSVHSQQPSK